MQQMSSVAGKKKHFLIDSFIKSQLISPKIIALQSRIKKQKSCLMERVSEPVPSGHVFPVFYYFGFGIAIACCQNGGKKDKRHQTEQKTRESNVPFSSA